MRVLRRLNPRPEPEIYAGLCAADGDSRRLAAEEISERRSGLSPRIEDQLRAMLRDDAPLVQAAAAHALTHSDRAETLNAFVEALASPLTSSEVIEDVQQAIEQYGEVAVDPVLDLMRDDDPIVRFYASETLGRLGEAKAVPCLLNALDDPDTGVRAFAAGALGEIGDRRALQGLEAASNDADEWVRDSAAVAVRRLLDGGEGRE